MFLETRSTHHFSSFALPHPLINSHLTLLSLCLALTIRPYQYLPFRIPNPIPSFPCPNSGTVSISKEEQSSQTRTVIYNTRLIYPPRGPKDQISLYIFLIKPVILSLLFNLRAEQQPWSFLRRSACCPIRSIFVPDGTACSLNQQHSVHQDKPTKRSGAFVPELHAPFTGKASALVPEQQQQQNMMVESDGTADATKRLNVKKQTLDDAYAVPANFLEIDVVNPMTTITPGKKRYTDYEVRMRVINSRT